MQGFQNILVPLDFSPSSATVLETALRVLAPGGRVLLLHVIEWMPSIVEGMFVGYSNPKDMGALRDESTAKLRKYAEAHPDARIDVEVTEGKPASTIPEIADREASDLIVIGSHQFGRIGHLLMGSQAEKVLRRAHCPILTVRVPA